MGPVQHRSAIVPRSEAGAPKTLDRQGRSVEFVVATEAAIPMWDWERGDVVPEVLLSRGAVLPKQVPLLDTHDRGSTQTVLGSVRDLRRVDGQIVGRAVFSSIGRAEEAWTQYTEGHLTDFSAGYTVNARTYVPKGETQQIAGRSWEGPVSVVTSWSLKEASACPIGADPGAKARADAAAAAAPKPTTKETKMDEQKTLEQIRAEEQAVQETRKAEQERVRAAERARIEEIRAMCRQWGRDDLVDLYIRNGDSIDACRKDLLDQLAKAAGESRTSSITLPVSFGLDERDKTRDVAYKSLLFRCGTRTDGYNPHDNDYSNMTLMDLCRDRLRMFRGDTRGSAEEIFKRAMTTSDLPQLLADVQNKYLYDGWEEAPITWSTWCDTGSIPDYKTAQFPRIGGFPVLSSVNANKGEYTYASLADETESATLGHYGNIVGLSLKLMVNDDLGALSRVPRLQGEAAARTVESAVYSTTLMASDGQGETMGDSNKLFDASNHGNWVASSSGAAPGLTTLNTLAQYMAVQKDAGANAFVGGTPRYIIAHPYYRATIDNLLVTTSPNQIGNAAGTAVYNPWAGLTPIYTPYLTVNSYKVWYIAGPKGKTVTVFGLNGTPRPVLEDMKSWTSAGWEYKVTLDFVTKAMDWRFLAGNYGS